MISVDKLITLMKAKNISIYQLKTHKIIGSATFDNIRTGAKMGGRGNGCKNVDTKTINEICKFLECQPGDIMEYIPEETE